LFNNIIPNVYDITWENIVEPDRTQMKIRRMRIACGYLRIQTHIQNMSYLLPFHGNSGCTNAL